MNTSGDVSKNLKCLVLRNGIEIWKESERLTDLGNRLMRGKIGFIKIDDEIVNSADIIGIFSPQVMEAAVRRKNGQWNCQYGKWHDRGEKCLCKENTPKLCLECHREVKGYVFSGGGVVCLDCVRELDKLTGKRA